ncbi:glucosidase 2 subunit beta [Eudromia elegans]
MWLLLPALLGALGGAAEVTRPRGVPLSQLHFYEDPERFTCLDGSATVAAAWVNDDYCDCADGSDEPGTAACPDGHFHCSNVGHRPQDIPSGHVNDGVCDCCDASDEYASGAACENTCKELGRREREDMERVAAVAREGFRLKQQLIVEATQRRQEQEARLAELRGGRGGLSERVAALRAAKEAAEGPERAAREEQRRRWQAEQQAAAEATEATETFGRLDTDGDGLLTVTELRGHPELDGDGDGAVSEDEAQALLGGDAAPVDVVTFRQRLWAGVKERLGTQEGSVTPPQVPPPALEQELGLDFGPQGEFSYLYRECYELETSDGGVSYLYRECYELETSEYIYRLCPFKRVSQKPKHGGAETNLGTWGSWSGAEGERFSTMRYEQGTGCWQGPSRSTTVRLACGTRTAVTATAEPSRCEYLMELETPAACGAPPPGAHDEL